MTRKRHTAEQISAVLKEAQAGIRVQGLCRKHGILDAIYYTWMSRRTVPSGLAPMEFINHHLNQPQTVQESTWFAVIS
jgi:transposase-like protein